MRSLIYIVTLLSKIIFFVAYAILGLQFEGSEGDNSYILFCFALDACVILTYSYDIVFKKRFKINYKELLCLFVLLLFLIMYLIERSGAIEAKQTIQLYIAFAIPSFLIAIDTAYKRNLGDYAKWLYLLMFFISVGSVLLLPGVLLGLTKGTYQSLSYYCGFAYSLNLFFLLFGDKFRLFDFYRWRTNKIISVMLLFVQTGVSLMSGGRGGFVIIIVATIVLFLFASKQMRFLKLVKMLLIVFAVCVISIQFLPSEISLLVENGSERVFSYISDKGIDMSQTSGRDDVFSEAIGFISQKPILGYGMFSYLDKTHTYPHNIFLEILLQGGLVYLFFFIFILIHAVCKYMKMLKVSADNLLLIPLAVYPFVMLLFSGSYLETSLFWFVLVYILLYKSRIGSACK